MFSASSCLLFAMLFSRSLYSVVPSVMFFSFSSEAAISAGLIAAIIGLFTSGGATLTPLTTDLSAPFVPQMLLGLAIILLALASLHLYLHLKAAAAESMPHQDPA